ncbi:MAG: type II CAAX endopeptidase family protein [Candidatus Woesebacteria bacterium]|jgi:membrane protease YdiL (CAAX protease family)
MTKKELFGNIKTLTIYLFVVWYTYRIFFNFSYELEELFIKPVLWLSMIIYLLAKEGKGLDSIGFSTKNLFPAIYFSLALGMGFAIEGIVVNFVKYRGINFSANLGAGSFWTLLGLSFATAFTEEITFRGYLFNRLWKLKKDEWMANLVSSLLWGLMHLPIALVWWKLGITGTLGYFILVTIFGVGSAFVFARTKNIASSILLHVFWTWPIMLFR